MAAGGVGGRGKGGGLCRHLSERPTLTGSSGSFSDSVNNAVPEAAQVPRPRTRTGASMVEEPSGPSWGGGQSVLTQWSRRGRCTMQLPKRPQRRRECITSVTTSSRPAQAAAKVVPPVLADPTPPATTTMLPPTGSTTIPSGRWSPSVS